MQRTSNLLQGIQQAFKPQTMPWDAYFMRMAETDFLAGRHQMTGVKSYFIRQAPFGGAFALLGGITAALNQIRNLRFDGDDFKRRLREENYADSFIQWLAERQFLRLLVYAPPEGQLFFPQEPIVSIVGPLPDLRLAEGLIIEALNFPTLSLTKWERLVRAVNYAPVLEFGRRRAQNADKASLYAMLAGCYATSNEEIGQYFDIPVIGTMGHEWVQSFGDVAQAFDVWLTHQPQRPIGLVDTKQCLQHDFPLWLDAVYAHQDAIIKANPPIWGWRNDSGDLAYLTVTQYKLFLQHPLGRRGWFIERLRIILTNELDEYAAQSIISQIREAAIRQDWSVDILGKIIWAAGTKPCTCDGQPSLGGVMKLMEADDFACIKLSCDAQGNPGPKTSIPGFNRSALILDKKDDGKVVMVLVYPYWRYYIENGFFYHTNGNIKVDLVKCCHPDNPALNIELRDYFAVPQQQSVYDSLTGEVEFTEWMADCNIYKIPRRIRKSIELLPWNCQRLDKPQVVPVYLTEDLFNLRQLMIRQGVLREDKLKKE